MALDWAAEERTLLNIKKIIAASMHLDRQQLYLLCETLQKKQVKVLPGQIGLAFLEILKWVSAREMGTVTKAWPVLMRDTECLLKLIYTYKGVDRKLWFAVLEKLETQQGRYFKTELGQAFILALKEKLGMGISDEKQVHSHIVYPGSNIQAAGAIDKKELEKVADWLMGNTPEPGQVTKKKKASFLSVQLKKASIPVFACLSACFMAVWLYGQVKGDMDRWNLKQMKISAIQKVDVVMDGFTETKPGAENSTENLKDVEQPVNRVKVQDKLRKKSHPGKLPQYREMSKKYPQLYGWLKIPDTQIDLPVMKPEGDREFYLHHDFTGSESTEGALFVDAGSSVYPQDDNTVIYGHNMKNGHIFGTLQRYGDAAYFQSHRKIYFDTLYEAGEYEVVAVLKTRLLNENEQGFRYYRFFQYNSESEFRECQKFVEQNQMFVTGGALQYGDKILMLSTCEYSQENGRFVVVARKL